MRRAWMSIGLAIACLTFLNANAEPVKGTAAKGPKSETESSNTTRNQRYPTPDSPFPVLTIKPDAEKQSDNKSAEELKDFNDEYLKTQISLAKSAQSQTPAVIGAAVFSLIGAILLFFTLLESRKSAKAAIASAEVVSGVELPMLSISNIDMVRRGVGNFAALLQCPYFVISVKNYGRTPAFVTFEALDVVCAEKMSSIPIYENAVFPSPDTVILNGGTRELGDIQTRDLFSDEELEDILAQRKWIFIDSVISYKDFLGKSHNRFFRNKVIPVFNRRSGEGTISFEDCSHEIDDGNKKKLRKTGLLYRIRMSIRFKSFYYLLRR